jgi:endonuclease/exonuclease/phosphatase family metal-dependent hydrolase
MARSVRLVHWNLRGGRDLSGKCSLARVVRAVEALKPSLLTLNEVDLRNTPALLAALSPALPHAHFYGHAINRQYGNALLSTVPLRHIVETPLDGGSVVQTKDGATHRIARGMLHAEAALAGVDLCVAVTHLDHMSREERGTQVAHVLRTLDAVAGERASAVQLLIGDMNALDRADYSDAEWSTHERHNKSKGWRAPSDDASAGGSLAMLADAGFVDVHASLERATAAQAPSSAWRTTPWTAHTHVAEGPCYRIDYVWSRSQPQNSDGPSLAPCAAYVERELDGSASDHQPVVIDFEAMD